MNLIVQLELERAYYNVTVQHVTGNSSSVTQVQTLDETVYVSFHAKTLEKSMKLLSSQLAVRVKQTGLFSLGWATSQGERKSWF